MKREEIKEGSKRERARVKIPKEGIENRLFAEEQYCDIWIKITKFGDSFVILFNLNKDGHCLRLQGMVLHAGEI